MNRPACPACRGPVHTARHVPGGITALYPCADWLPRPEGEAVARDLEQRREVRP
jgi:hypothetical protein